MSRLSQVIHDKNRLEKAEKERREREMRDIKQDTAYRAKLYDDMRVVRVMLADPEVEAVHVEVPERHITQFMRAVYSDEMAEYSVTIDGNKATISRKLIEL